MVNKIYGLTIISSDGDILVTKDGKVTDYAESMTKLFDNEHDRLDYAVTKMKEFFASYEFEDGEDEMGETEDDFEADLKRGEDICIQGCSSHTTFEYFTQEMASTGPLEVPYKGYGTIIMYPDTDPNYPGACIMYRPDGREEEIDLAYVKGVPDKEAVVTGEKPGDISLYLYADPWSEDFTEKRIVSSNEILEAVTSTDDKSKVTERNRVLNSKELLEYMVKSINMDRLDIKPSPGWEQNELIYWIPLKRVHHLIKKYFKQKSIKMGITDETSDRLIEFINHYTCIETRYDPFNGYCEETNLTRVYELIEEYGENFD